MKRTAFLIFVSLCLNFSSCDPYPDFITVGTGNYVTELQKGHEVDLYPGTVKISIRTTELGHFTLHIFDRQTNEYLTNEFFYGKSFNKELEIAVKLKCQLRLSGETLSKIVGYTLAVENVKQQNLKFQGEITSQLFIQDLDIVKKQQKFKYRMIDISEGCQIWYFICSPGFESFDQVQDCQRRSLEKSGYSIPFATGPTRASVVGQWHFYWKQKPINNDPRITCNTIMQFEIEDLRVRNSIFDHTPKKESDKIRPLGDKKQETQEIKKKAVKIKKLNNNQEIQEC